MSLTELIIFYSIELLFWLWIIRWGGAEWLEGSFIAGLFVNVFASRWSADGIRLFAYGSMIITTILFIIALFSPDFRGYF